MKKSITIGLLAFAPFFAFAQRLIDSKAIVNFFSEAPLENIEASNEEVLGALDMTTGSVAVTMNMKDFHFDKSLMEEHFNENYIESDKYPKATFSGSLAGFNATELESLIDSITYQANGKLNLHGVSREVTLPVVITKSNNKINIKSTFIIRIEDYNIEVPTLLIKNIAEDVLVTAKFSFNTK